MLRKSVLFVLTLAMLGGCGYKGALYIPEAPSANTPEGSSSAVETSTTSPKDNTLPATTSGEPI
ncbi:LPS translocon maturation chaperone LptM [Alteromonas sp. D210916BOD_24]|uniref:LPS translocon maturation chaperone LptM n=1 Tax=Alteromonas sp. D210916BOD_24 TaxID=3157618 RepID=UPI00399CE349